MLRVGIYSLLVNLALVGAKLTLSIIAGSLALRADAIHSLVDVFGSIALILGLFISGRKSKSFPYGLYKVENLVSVIISVLLFLTAYEIVREAITGEMVAVPYGGWVLGVVGALILVPFLFGRYEVSVGKKVNSPSLIADGSQFKADVLSSSVVFFALIGQRFGLPLDRIAAAVIALFIVRAGWGLLANSMRVLLDASIDQGTLEQVRLVIMAEPAVSGVQDVTGRNSGRYFFVEAVVTLRISDLERAHSVSERIEDRIRKTVPNVDRVLIHYEPQSKTQLRYAVALTSTQGKISQHFGESHYFALVDVDFKEKKVQRQEIVANPHLDLIKGKGIKVAEFLLSYKPDVIVARENLSGKGPGYAFAEAGVETIQTEAKSLDEFLDQLIRG
ncbi:MAG: cation diffusion facilitator family transporter [Chloroflexi bacterium]|nr:cation diffusion facilitator family transporter [Chloroflexota bacterium]